MYRPRVMRAHKRSEPRQVLRRLSLSISTAVTVGALFAACGEDPAAPPPPDSTDAGDAATAAPDATSDSGSDAGGDVDAATAEPDAGGDADADAPIATPTFLAFAGVTTTNVPYGGTFGDDGWSTTSLGTDIFSSAGGGVVVLDGTHALVSFRGNVNTTSQTAAFDGSWSQLVTRGPSSVNFVAAPAVTPTGAAVAYQSGSGTNTISILRYERATTTWTTASESTGALNDNVTLPALVPTSAGEVLLFGGLGESAYGVVVKNGETWGTPTTIPGSTKSSSDDRPKIVGVRRAGTDDVVAVWTEATSSATKVLRAGTLSGGTWHVGAEPLATDIAPALNSSVHVLAALPDGRVALAYLVASTFAMKLAFFDGTAWSAFATIPGTSTRFARGPIALAAGLGDSAIVEVVYVDASRNAQHTRLTGESPPTWSTATAVDTKEYDTIFLSSGR